MTEPQVWVLIGTFAAAVLGGMTFSTNLIVSCLLYTSDAADE